MKKFYYAIYYLSYLQSFLLLLITFVIWMQLMEWYRDAPRKEQHTFKLVCFGLLVVWCLIVLAVTLFSRSLGPVQPPVLLPFSQLLLYVDTRNPEILRMLVLNVQLFLPGGLLLDALFPHTWKRGLRLSLTVLLLAGFSFTIEACQWQYALGRAEMDDLICNTLGAILGSLIHEAAIYVNISQKNHSHL